MQYIDLAYLQGLMPLQKIVECCDDYGAGELDVDATANLDACEQSAVADVHLYCRGLYTVPFDPVPGEVMELTAQLTKCYLYMRRAAEDVPESISLLYKRLLDKLKAITANTFRIDAGDDDAVAAAQGPRVTETTQRFPQGFQGRLLDES
jgi:phage gp36-like protein